MLWGFVYFRCFEKKLNSRSSSQTVAKTSLLLLDCETRPDISVHDSSNLSPKSDWKHISSLLFKMLVHDIHTNVLNGLQNGLQDGLHAWFRRHPMMQKERLHLFLTDFSLHLLLSVYVSPLNQHCFLLMQKFYSFDVSLNELDELYFRKRKRTEPLIQEQFFRVFSPWAPVFQEPVCRSVAHVIQFVYISWESTSTCDPLSVSHHPFFDWRRRETGNCPDVAVRVLWCRRISPTKTNLCKGHQLCQELCQAEWVGSPSTTSPWKSPWKTLSVTLQRLLVSLSSCLFRETWPFPLSKVYVRAWSP